MLVSTRRTTVKQPRTNSVGSTAAAKGANTPSGSVANPRATRLLDSDSR